MKTPVAFAFLMTIHGAYRRTAGLITEIRFNAENNSTIAIVNFHVN